MYQENSRIFPGPLRWFGTAPAGSCAEAIRYSTGKGASPRLYTFPYTSLGFEMVVPACREMSL